MNRRNTILALVALGTTPLASFAQRPGKVWRVGLLLLDTPSAGTRVSEPFLQGMRELGYIEGQNLIIESRFANGDFERLPALATELVQLRVDVIVAQASPAISAAQKATTSIPIVMATTGDPVGSGFVKSLARPGGNITGLSNMGGDTGAKLLDLMRSVVPALSRVALLVSSTSTTSRVILKTVQGVADNAGVKTLVIEVSSPQNIDDAFAAMARERAEAVIVGPAPFLTLQQRQIADLALKYRMPSVCGNRSMAEAGVLMSYAQVFAEGYRRAATYVDKILKGANPGDLPVEQPTQFELVVNLKTAKALGVAIPQSILVRANKVID